MVFVLICTWVGFLGGLRFTPAAGPEEGSNDTSGIFNFHPILMALAFPVLMGEAVIIYRAPLFCDLFHRCAGRPPPARCRTACPHPRPSSTACGE